MRGFFGGRAWFFGGAWFLGGAAGFFGEGGVHGFSEGGVYDSVILFCNKDRLLQEHFVN